MEDWYLESVALTNVPFLTELPAITNKKNDVEVKHMEWWKTLGYTSEEEAIKGINSQKSELAEANRINAELQTKLTAEQAKTADLLSKANAAEVEAAVLAKKILPGQKEIALKLINSDRGLFDEFVAANAGVRIEGLSTETVIPESEKKDPLSQVSSYKQLLDDKALCAKFEAEKPEDYKALYHRWMTEKK
jgi:hypothetical protein